MNTKSSRSLVIALVLVLALFLLFGGGAMTGGMMNGGMHGLNENGWMSNRGWMWFPALITLGIGIAIGWVLFKKK